MNRHRVYSRACALDPSLPKPRHIEIDEVTQYLNSSFGSGVYFFQKMSIDLYEKKIKYKLSMCLLPVHHLLFQIIFELYLKYF